MTISLEASPVVLNVSQEELRATLSHLKEPIAKRMRAVFGLKHLKDIDGVAMGLKDPSALMKHEAAYLLGQVSLLSCVNRRD